MSYRIFILSNCHSSLDYLLTCHVPASTPMLLQLSPLIAVALGTVGSVILLVLAVVAALKLRRRHEKKPGDSTKHSSESNDSVEKNPDIIPHSNGKTRYNINLTAAVYWVGRWNGNRVRGFNAEVYRFIPYTPTVINIILIRWYYQFVVYFIPHLFKKFLKFPFQHFASIVPTAPLVWNLHLNLG